MFFPCLYGVEAWTLNSEVSKKIEVFKMWVYRRMLNISRTDRITNVGILRRVNQDKEVLNMIKIRELQYHGHVSRGSKYNFSLKIQGKRNVGRRCKSR